MLIRRWEETDGATHFILSHFTQNMFFSKERTISIYETVGAILICDMIREWWQVRLSDGHTIQRYRKKNCAQTNTDMKSQKNRPVMLNSGVWYLENSFGSRLNWPTHNVTQALMVCYLQLDILSLMALKLNICSTAVMISSIFERYSQLTSTKNQLWQPLGPISPAFVKTSLEQEKMMMMVVIIILIIIIHINIVSLYQYWWKCWLLTMIWWVW